MFPERVNLAEIASSEPADSELRPAALARQRRSADNVRNMRRTEFVLVSAVALLVGWAAGYLLWGRPRPAEGITVELREDRTYLIQRVVDGDTVVLSSGLHLRYIGIDAPEAGHWGNEPEPFAGPASARNRELVEGRAVQLRFERERIDRYGRILAHVYVPSPGGEGEISVEETLVSEGLARAIAIGGNTDLYPRLKALEMQARRAERGIWSGQSEVSGAARAAESPFVAARDGEVIHRALCPHARRIAPARRLGYPTLEDARASGRRFCKSCRPQRWAGSSANPDR